MKTSIRICDIQFDKKYAGHWLELKMGEHLDSGRIHV